MKSNSYIRGALTALFLFGALSLSGCRGEPAADFERGASAPADVAPPVEGPSGKDLPRAPAPQYVRHTWRDGDELREVWMDPVLLLDHLPLAEAPKGTQQWLADARERSAPGAAVRMLELPPGALDSGSVTLKLAQAGAPRRYSPAFRDAPAGTGSLRSLPGGVVVTFDEVWSQSAAEGWLAARGLAIERRLELGRPSFVVASDSGLAALQLANELAELPELRSAQPDWWLPATRN